MSVKNWRINGFKNTDFKSYTKLLFLKEKHSLFESNLVFEIYLFLVSIIFFTTFIPDLDPKSNSSQPVDSKVAN